MNHINYMVSKLCESCYVARYMFHTSNTDTSKSIHFAYFHSIIKCGTILGNSAVNTNIFTLQKNVKIIVGAKLGNSF